MLLKENVAMTVEIKTDKSCDSSKSWEPNAHRQGERPQPAKAQPETPPDDQIIFASISAPPIWPRVFPGI